MRILITCDPFIPVPPVQYGGIERIVDGLIRGLRAAGENVALLAHPDSTAAVDARFAWPAAGQTRVDHLRNARALYRAMSVFRPDVIHSFSRLAYLLPALLAGKPTVMSYQREISTRRTRLARGLARGPLVFTACSAQLARKGEVGGGHWQAIHNFVELERFQFREHVDADAPLVFLSRLDQVKGADRAIRIAKAAGRRLILAGNRAESGSDRRYFENEIAPHLDGKQVDWIGPVNDRQKNELLGGALALLVPIRWEEPFGIVFAEALACGTPVLSCPRGALPEIVEHGVHGFLDDSEQGLSEAVARIAGLSRHACRAKVERVFSSTVITEKYRSLYRRIGRGVE